MHLQKDTKNLFENHELVTPKYEKYFSEEEFKDWKKEYDTFWEETMLPESVLRHANYQGEYAGSGPVDYIEGLFLYCFTRKIKPNSMMEVGVAQGISTCIMAKALENNQNGYLIAIDINQPSNPCALFEKYEAKGIINFVKGDAIKYIENFKEKTPDLVFLDADHWDPFCSNIVSLFQNNFNDNTIYLYHEWSLCSASKQPEVGFISRQEWLGQFKERDSFERIFDSWKHDGVIGSCGLGICYNDTVHNF